MTGILDTVKKGVGVPLEDPGFDPDLILYINSTLSILSQLGLIEVDKLPIIDQDDTWDDLFNGRTDLEIVKTYITFKVKSMFDPPTSSAAMESMKQIISELEWRIVNLKTIMYTSPVV